MCSLCPINIGNENVLSPACINFVPHVMMIKKIVCIDDYFIVSLPPPISIHLLLKLTTQHSNCYSILLHSSNGSIQLIYAECPSHVYFISNIIFISLPTMHCCRILLKTDKQNSSLLHNYTYNRQFNDVSQLCV